MITGQAWIDLSRWLDEQTRRPVTAIDQSIAGCESGPGHREDDRELAWYRSIRDQCAAADVAFFLKQARKTPRDTSTDGVLFAIDSGHESWTKGDIIEQPYLDGVQHVAFPRPR